MTDHGRLAQIVRYWDGFNGAGFTMGDGSPHRPFSDTDMARAALRAGYWPTTEEGVGVANLTVRAVVRMVTKAVARVRSGN